MDEKEILIDDKAYIRLPADVEERRWGYGYSLSKFKLNSKLKQELHLDLYFLEYKKGNNFEDYFCYLGVGKLDLWAHLGKFYVLKTKIADSYLMKPDYVLDEDSKRQLSIVAIVPYKEYNATVLVCYSIPGPLNVTQRVFDDTVDALRADDEDDTCVVIKYRFGAMRDDDQPSESLLIDERGPLKEYHDELKKWVSTVKVRPPIYFDKS